jgi:hypothetical protein
MLGIVMASASKPVGAAPCEPGVYGRGQEGFVVIGLPLPGNIGGQRYLFRDGRRGATAAAQSPVACDSNLAIVTQPDGSVRQWAREATLESEATFTSVATKLVGRLIEPPGDPDPRRPLVVLVHGSEKTAAIHGVYAYMLAAQGASVFVYDKRGTGTSGGDYTQNFELLADDAAAALQKARQMAAGRFGRAGYFGSSQGGWVAPLAATRSTADFVAVGFGLITSPIEEDREQMLDEARRMNLDTRATALVRQLSRATAMLVRSHFVRGYEALAQVKQRIGSASWAATINGEYSGDMLRMSESDLRRVGRARFDNLGLIWDYDAMATLRKLKVPLLWVLAADDREAPIETTRAALLTLVGEGRHVDAFLFPDTDHGMVEYRINDDGGRTPTRITDGYLKLVADWVKGEMTGSCGRGQQLR